MQCIMCFCYCFYYSVLLFFILFYFILFCFFSLHVRINILILSHLSAIKGARRVIGFPMYCILQGIQLEVGHDLIDHVYCTNTSMPEHEAVPLSHKTCLRIEAVTFI